VTHWGNWRKVNFVDQLRHSSEMAATLTFHWFSHQRLGRLVWFFGGSLG
jgi:hypothetical protein